MVTKYKSVYRIQDTARGYRPYIKAIFSHGGRIHQKSFNDGQERAAALWVDKKRIEMGLEPINILKRLVK